MKYKIVKEQCTELLEKEVNRMLAAGWEVAGGIHMHHSSPVHFYQSMVIEEKTPKLPKGPKKK